MAEPALDFSTAEWKAKIQEHERKLSLETDQNKFTVEKQKSSYLENIHTSYTSQYRDLIARIEQSHKTSHEATTSVLNQLYTDYDNYKKEAQTKFYELNYNLSTTQNKLSNSETDSDTKAEQIRVLEKQLEKTRRKLSETEETLATSMAEHSDEIQKSTRLEVKLTKMEDKVERMEIKIKELNKKLGGCEKELIEAREVIENLKESQKQRTGPTVDFFKGVRVVNVPPFVCDGAQKNMMYLNVSEMVELESIGFLGPLNCDAIYEVTLQINQMKPRGNKWKTIAQVTVKVTARRQQVFHVDFDEPISLEDYASEEDNSFTNANGFYTIYYSLKGPNTQSADILNGDETKDICKEVDGVMFYTKWYHNQWAELGFQKCLKYKSLVIFQS